MSGPRSLLLSAAPAALAACGVVSGADPPPDILLLTVDSLRSDFLGCHGHPRGATPVLDELARVGLSFERHYTVAGSTLPAHAAMLTGLPPAAHGVRSDGMGIPEGLPVLAEGLSARGYRTAAVVAASVLDHGRGLERGFESFDDEFERTSEEPGAPRVHERPAGAVVARALEFVEGADSRPLFLWVHLYDPHHPYEPPVEYAVEAAQAIETYVPRAEPSSSIELPEIVAAMAGYEGEVRYADAEIGRLLAAWDVRRHSGRSVIAVTSDHGEALGEHSLLGHGSWSFEEQLLVPLLVRLPGGEHAGVRVVAPTSHLDLAATLLDLVGAPQTLPGTSLRPLWEGVGRWERPVFAERSSFEVEHCERSSGDGDVLDEPGGRRAAIGGEQVALVRDSWKYIWTEDAAEELYDLSTDPGEDRNAAREHADRAAAMRLEVEAWRRTAAAARESSAPVGVEIGSGAGVPSQHEGAGGEPAGTDP